MSAGDLADFLEKEIAAGRNPSTPAEWDDFLERAMKANKAKYLGETEHSAGYIAGSLRDEGINAKVLKNKSKGGEKDA